MFEYHIIPAPTRGKRAKGAKTPADRFSVALRDLMNELGQDGWEYHRAETLPFEERSRLGRKSSGFQTVLVFRRPLAAPDAHVAQTHSEYYFPPASEEVQLVDEEPAYVPENEYAPSEETTETHEVEPEAEPLTAQRPSWLRSED